MRLMLFSLALALSMGSTVSAQVTAGDEVVKLAMAPVPAEGGPGDSLVVIHALEGVELALVKGAPYQAEAVTEMVQVLADGNRIVRESRATVARDSEGRTRRERGLVAVGPLMTGPEPRQTVFLQDPVAGASYVLEPEQKVARKLPAAPALSGPDDPLRFEYRAGGGFGIAAAKPFRKRLPKPEEEPLGTKLIEGVEAVGTRTTMTIRAGEVGNERPIVVVSERWHSSELKLLVLSRHNDPRFGETTYRLTNITRGEPDHALFEVPSDYTIKEGPPGPHMEFNKKFRKELP